MTKRSTLSTINDMGTNASKVTPADLENNTQDSEGELESLTSMKALLSPMKAIGLLNYSSSQPRRRFMKLYSFFMLTIYATLSVQNIAVIGTNQDTALSSKFVNQILMLSYTVQLVVCYSFSPWLSKRLQDFLTKFRETAKGGSTSARVAKVLKIVSYGINALLSLNIVSSAAMVMIAPQLVKLYSWMAYPIPFKPPWIYVPLALRFAFMALGNLAGFMYLELYVMVCALLASEFISWNQQFSKSITSDGRFTGDLRKFRRNFENLVDLVTTSDGFLSVFIAINFLTTVPALCFTSYSLLTGALTAEEVAGFAASLTLSAFIVTAVGVGGCVVCQTVSNTYTYTTVASLPPITGLEKCMLYGIP